VCDARRVGAALSSHNRCPKPVRPNGQLFHRRRPKGIRRSEYHALLLGNEHRREFRNRGRLAATIDTTDHNDRRSRLGKDDRGGRLRHRFFEFRLDDCQDILHFGNPALELLAYLFGNFFCHRHPHVGFDKRFKEFVQKLVVDESAGRFENIADIRIQDRNGLRQSLLNAVKKSHAAYSTLLRVFCKSGTEPAATEPAA
jgi:hypothetical protein